MGTQRVLVIDFDPEFLKFMCRFLQDKGFSVLSAQDGSTGLELYQQEKPDLVVTEAMLPKLPGFELCSRIAKSGKVPVVIVTGVYKDAAYKTEALRTFGAKAFFEKPLNTEAFLAKIEEILGIAGPAETAPRKREEAKSPEKAGRLWDQVKSLENVDLLLEKTLAEFGIHPETKKPAVSRPVPPAPKESSPVVIKESQSVSKTSPLPTNEDFFNLIKTTPPARKPAPPIPPYREEKSPVTEDFVNHVKTISQAPEPAPPVQPRREEKIPAPAAAAVDAGGAPVSKKTEVPLKKNEQNVPVTPEVSSGSEAAAPRTARDAGESAEVKSAILSKKNMKTPEKKIAEDEPRPEASFPGFSYGTLDEKRPRAISPKVFGIVGGTVFLAVFMIFILKAGGSRNQASPPAGNELDRRATASTPRTEDLQTSPAASAESAGKSAIESHAATMPAGILPTPAPVKAVPEKARAENPQPAVKNKAAQNTPARDKAPEATVLKPKDETPVQEVVASETLQSSHLSESVRGIEDAHSEQASGQTAPKTAAYIKTGDLVALEETDVKPVLIQKAPPVYPPTALMTKQQGSVIVRALISEKGDVLETSIVHEPKSRSGGIFDKAAQTAVKKWKFRPARKNGFDVRVWNEYTISFKIGNE